MTETDFLDAEDVRLLVDVGFMALSAGLTDKAETIFAGAKAARPGQEAGSLGLALTDLARGRVEGAVARLKALPPSDAVLTYLGIALMRQGEREAARAILADVVATAGEPAFADLARQTLAEHGFESLVSAEWN